MKKKVLFIVKAMVDGVLTYIVELANDQVNIYDMYVAYAVRKQTPSNYKDYFDKRIYLIEVKNFGHSINPTKDVNAFFEIERIAKEVELDVIHLHSSKAGPLGCFVFNGKKTPLFYTPHGYSFLMQNHSTAKRFVYKLVETVCAKRKYTTISCSEGEHQETLKLTKRATYVNNGINVNELQELIDSVGLGEKQSFTVFTLGRICYQKNPALFNKIALAMLDVRFVWIGDGELRKELTAPNIEITGWAERNIALEHSLHGDVFLLTSLWEGLPMSLLESMYMKKLCIVNDVIGNRDVIHTGDSGFVCREVDEFVKAIREAENSNGEDLIEKAYQDVFEQYYTTVMAQKYSGIYKETLTTENIARGVQHKVVLYVVYANVAYGYCSREAVAA